MEGKFTVKQKIVLASIFLLIIASGVIRMFTYTLDKGALLTLVIVALILYTVLCTAALFPATWRMTSKEKEKIRDKTLYQKKYTNVFVLVNAVLSCVMVFLIWIV